MSAKISAARRAAFLRALKATGNQTLAAERAKVSRSWVLLHRKRDPAFDAAVRAACLDFAREERSGTEPPSGWGFLDGEELVVRGTGGAALRQAQGERKSGKRVQIARARIRQWSPRVEDRFLATLAATCNVKAACAEVGLTATSAYEHRKRWPAFARRWDEAVRIGYSRLEGALVANGINLFSREGVSAETPIPQMTVSDVIRCLSMHKHAVHGIGGRPGLRRQREPTIEEVREKIMRKLDALKRARGLGEAEKARDWEEYARRRDAGEAGAG